MKKLVLAAALAASLSNPVIASDVSARPWGWNSTVKVTSVAKTAPLLRTVVVIGFIKQNPVLVPDGYVDNPTLTLHSGSVVTLNGARISLPGGSALPPLVGATCVVEGETPHLSKTHMVIKATCTK